MIEHRYFDKIVLIMIVISIIFVCGLYFPGQWGIDHYDQNSLYENKVFDDSYVHVINIEIDDVDSFFEKASEEKYIKANITIDGETFKNVGLRVKGNNSLRLIERYGLKRYSLKIEFDHYNKEQTYYGLDKMSLDCSFQDNSYLKNYMTYKMMAHMNVPSPLCSYSWVTINSKDWGLFLVLEEVEEAFIKRNFNNTNGQLYKPGYKNINDKNYDIALKYISDDINDYPNIFDEAKFKPNKEDQKRLIRSIKILNSNKQLETITSIDQLVSYFVIHVFTVNLDSYAGITGHNYFLYEDKGKLTIIPWDYNLAFATYSLGMEDPINDSTLYINYPIDTPGDKTYINDRPLFNQMINQYHDLYHQYFNDFIKEFYESGKYSEMIKDTTELISPYVYQDPTAFCSYNDYLIAVETFEQFCKLRFESIKRQLKGDIGISWEKQKTNPNRIDASFLYLPDLGDINDLK